MARKQKMNFKFVCLDCGKQQEPKQNGNWNEYSSTCQYCGGKVDMQMDLGNKTND